MNVDETTGASSSGSYNGKLMARKGTPSPTYTGGKLVQNLTKNDLSEATLKIVEKLAEDNKISVENLIKEYIIPNINKVVTEKVVTKEEIIKSIQKINESWGEYLDYEKTVNEVIRDIEKFLISEFNYPLEKATEFVKNIIKNNQDRFNDILYFGTNQKMNVEEIAREIVGELIPLKSITKAHLNEIHVDPSGNLISLKDDDKLISDVDAYIEKLQKYSDEDMVKNFPKLIEIGMSPIFDKIVGDKYVKIIKKDPSSKAVFAFVDAKGDIFKPASANAPAKGIRGNIYAEKVPLSMRELYR